MTTIRNKKALRQFVDHATPDDRLRHTSQMGEPDDYAARKELSVDAVWLMVKAAAVLIAVYLLWRAL